MKYLKEYKYIWNHYVPEKGQAGSVQGELLRQIEKLRFEAQNNGNLNWDDNFDYFCFFIKSTLCRNKDLSGFHKSRVSIAIDRIKSAGQTARLYNTGRLSNLDLEKNKRELAYIKDDFYDWITEAIIVYYLQNKQPIPYKANPEIIR